MIYISAAQLKETIETLNPFQESRKAYHQTITNKPLLKRLMKKQKTFVGGNGEIAVPIVGDYQTALIWYSQDQITSYNSSNTVRQAKYLWAESHIGLKITLTELKTAGFTIPEGDTKPKKLSAQESAVVVNFIEEKENDRKESRDIGMNQTVWGDGTQNSLAFPGIKSMITDSPSQGTTGGYDRGQNPYWRNRALVGAQKITASRTEQTFTRTIGNEIRQYKRYGGRPDFMVAGSGALEALEFEALDKIQYSQTGAKEETEIGINALRTSVGLVEYDPYLDEIGESKRIYIIDTNAIHLRVMESEDNKNHTPARPHDQYVYYSATTWTGGLVARQLNGSGVIEVA
jgi:hypothetical protein